MLVMIILVFSITSYSYRCWGWSCFNR